MKFRVVVIAPLALAVATLGAQAPSTAQRFQHAVELLETQGDVSGAVREFEQLAAGADRELAARSLFYIGLAREKSDPRLARQAYERLVRDFSEQTEAVARARARLALLAAPLRPMTRSLVAHPVFDRELPLLGRPSADGRLIPVFAKDGFLAVYNAATGERTKYGKEGGPPDVASISPDGRQVAFVQNAAMQQQLMLSPLDHWAPRALHGFDKAVRALAWAPDGERLAVALRGKGASQVALVSVADGTVTVAKELGAPPPSTLDWSPDGLSLAYDRPAPDDASQLDIFVLDLENGEERPIVEHPAQDFGPRWTPDGSGLVFFSDRTGGVDIWLQPVASSARRGEPRVLYRNAGRGEPTQLTRDGTLLYERQDGLVDVYTVPFDESNAQATGQPVVASPRATGSNNTCAWSPDGTRLAVVHSLATASGENSAIAIRDSDGTSGRDLSPPMYWFLGLAWSPDGKEFLTKGFNQALEYGYYRIDATSAAVTPVLTVDIKDEDGYGRAIWSPDGRAIVYLGPRGIVKRDVASGQEDVVAAETEVERPVSTWFRFSPDGRSFAFVTERKDVSPALRTLKVRGADGRVREVYSGRPRDLKSFDAWTPDGKWLLFVRVPEISSDGRDYTGEVWAVSSTGGDPHPTGLAMSHLRGVNVSPDGRRLAFTAGNPTWELWAIEHLVPAATAGDRTAWASAKASARAQKQR